MLCSARCYNASFVLQWTWHSKTCCCCSVIILVFKKKLMRKKCGGMLLVLMQVILMFAQPFWPAHFFDVVCTDSFIPEFWVTSPPVLAPSQPQPASAHPGGRHDSNSSNATLQQPQQHQSAEPPVHCMVGFVAGSRAEEISMLRQNSVIIQTLSQLDQMFGKPQPLCSGRYV